MKELAQIHITGIVQGVGFRPFIFNLALRMGLYGWVRNTSGGVDIEIEGERSMLDSFMESLSTEAPTLACIETINVRYANPKGLNSFDIIQSALIQGAFQPISPDICICSDCLRELFDPQDNRYLYPFINCTNCGPRFTIIQNIPYDRPLTTMGPFQMCSMCNEEYLDPLNRRFHAQPVACSKCGPTIWIEDCHLINDEVIHLEQQAEYSQSDTIIKAQYLLAEGKIIAIKGLGGFHLACDATNGEAVRELRNRKLRVDKPFALMMADLDTVQRHCYVDSYEARLLESKERPIVILHRKQSSNIARNVAPNQSTLGVMLPYTPLHYLLFSDAYPQQKGNKLAKPPIPSELVMTSGNLREEPIAIDNNEARSRLTSLCDAFLMHNRDIHIRCDDSVVRVFNMEKNRNININLDNVIYPIRRSRGYAPFPVRLSKVAPPILAVGGELKNTFCITQKYYAFLSHHIGDMENYETLQSFEDGIKHFERLFRVKPEIISYDLHPNYLSSRYAIERSQAEGTPSICVQHHHAHIAACMAENQLSEDNKVIGVAFDGTGFGTDGAIWGGEFLIADYMDFHRYAHIEYMPLPGGDTAIRNPARIALAYLWQLGKSWDETYDSYNTLGDEERSILKSQLENKINTPLTSSMGRLFDAISAIIGVRQKINYEAQAAIELEGLVDQNERTSYPFDIEFPGQGIPGLIRLTSMVESIIVDLHKNIPVSIISARFHNTIAKIVFETIMAMRNSFGESTIILSGGVWQNMTLLHKTIELLHKEKLKVYIHRHVPSNDGGIALGQAAIAMYRSGI